MNCEICGKKEDERNITEQFGIWLCISCDGEYSDEELIKMIKQEEKKLIKKGVMKTIKVSVMSMLGLSWLPFI